MKSIEKFVAQILRESMSITRIWVRCSAFTLAEMMVVMLIVSIALAAMAPVMTTKMKSDRAREAAGSIWQWTTGNSGIYFDQGGERPVVIGQREVVAKNPTSLLVLNTDNTDRNHILFKNRDTVLGRLQISSDSLILGSNIDVKGSPSIVVGMNITSLNRLKNSIIIGGSTDSNNVITPNMGPNKICIGFDSCLSNSVNLLDQNERIYIGSKSTYNNETAVLEVHNVAASEDWSVGTRVTVNGNLVISGTTYENSDRRLKYVGKENKDGLSKLRQIKVFNYTFKKDHSKEPRVGVIAQDLQKIFPNAVKKGSDGFLTIRMDDMFYALINAVKELDVKVTGILNQVQNDKKVVTEILKQVQDDRVQIQNDKNEIQALKKENKELKLRLEKLEAKLK